MSKHRWHSTVSHLFPLGTSVLDQWRKRLAGLPYWTTDAPAERSPVRIESAMNTALMRRRDPVSLLPNRLGLAEWLASGVHLGGADSQCAVIELHLPHYRLLCAAFSGVELRPLLRMLGEVLQATAGARGLAARLDEDTYLLVLPDLTCTAEAHARSAELLVTLAALRMTERPGLRIWGMARLGFLPPDEVVPLDQVLAALDDLLDAP